MGKRGPKPKPRLTRATPAQVSTEEKADRIRSVVGLMAGQRWETGITGPSLAREWGVAESTVNGYAAVASKLVLAELGGEDLRARILVGLESLGAEARRSGDFKTAGHLLAEMARISGVDAPTRVDVRTQQVTIAEIVANPDFVLPEKSE